MEIRSSGEGVTLMSSSPKCPICGGDLEDGYCYCCGYDRFTEGGLLDEKPLEEKKSDGILDILLDTPKDDSWWSF